jgi:hypothetical protein
MSMAWIKFKDKETQYLEWKSQNPEGLILNLKNPAKTLGGKIHHKPSVRLHQANCPRIKRGRGGDGEYTQREYYKVCGKKLSDIESYCEANVEFRDGSSMDWHYARCKSCSPI